MRKVVSIIITLTMLLNCVPALALAKDKPIIDILTDSSENKVKITSNSDVSNAKCYVATYKDGAMTGAVSKPTDLKIGENVINMAQNGKSSDSDIVKIFLWDENMEPLADAVIAKTPMIAVETLYADVTEKTVKAEISVLNNPGVSSLKFDVAYDDCLTLTDVELSEDFGAYLTAAEPFTNPQPISMISPLKDIHTNGVIATLTFDVSNVPEGKKYADISVVCDDENIFDAGFEYVDFATANGKIIFDKALTLAECAEEKTELMSAENLTLTVNGVSGMPGEYVDVKLTLSNNPGIASLMFNVEYSDILSLEAVNFNPDFGAYATAAEPFTNPQLVSFISPFKDVSVDDTFAILTFKISDTADDKTVADVNITFNEEDVFNSSYEYVDLTVVNGKVTVYEGIPGDINADGKVNNMDAILLFRYVAGWNVEVDEEALDVTGDGRVSNIDAIELFRYVGGWTDITLHRGNACEHALTRTEKKSATCTEDGNIEYWHCSKCDKYYSDAKAMKMISLSETVEKATGHTEVVIPAVAPTYDKSGLTEERKCSVCGVVTVEQTVLKPLVSKQHSITYIVSAGDYIDQGDAYLQAQIIDNPNPQVYSENELVTLKKLSTPGYTFDGWVDQSGKRWDVIPKGTTEDLVLYAKWTQDVYTVTFNTPDVDVSYTWYDPNKGSNVNLKNSAKYTIDTGLTLTNPTAYKYTFVGWSNDDGFIVNEIKPGTTGNITLRANWTADRNRATSYSDYGDPIIIEDYDRKQFLFVYDIGKIDNVPLYTYKKSSGEEIRFSNTTVDFSSTTTLKAEFGKENAQNIAKTVANATTRSSGWTLSEGWNEVLSESREDSEKLVKSEERTDSKGNTVGNKYFVSNSEGGSSYTSAESGSTSSSSAKVTTEDSFGINKSYDESTEKYCEAELKAGFKNETELSAGVSLPVDIVNVSAGVKNTTTVTADAKLTSGRKDNTAFHVDTSASTYVGTDTQKNSSSYYNAVTNNSTNWNSNEGYEKSSEMSQETTVSAAIAKEIESTTTYNISKSLSGAKENTESVSGTTSDETGYSNSVTVSEYFTEENVYAEAHKDDHVGYHRLVEAGIVHVYGVVGYDIATASYYTYTFNVLEDDTYAYWDYSLKDPSFKDCENGLVTFEIPFEVNEYIAGVTGQTDGLEIEIDDNGFGYVKNFEASEGFTGDVVVPQYLGADNLDDTDEAVRVTGFSADAFRGNTQIKTVILPIYVTEIPDYAFEGCTNLETVIAYGVTKIGKYAFKDCENLGKFVNGNGETEYGAFMIDNLVTELGEGAFSGVNEIKVMAYDSRVADAAIASGAKKITVDLTKLADDYTGTKEIKEGTKYFGIIGGGKIYKGLKIKSDARETFVSNLTLADNKDIPLELSSETVSLLRVTVDNAPGIALSLGAENTSLKLYRTVTLTSKSENSVLSRSVTLSKANTSITGTLDFSGKYLVCGKIENTSMLKHPENVNVITETEYEKYMTAVTVSFNTDGGTAVSSVTVGYDSKIAEPTAPTKDKHSFVGWYTDKACTKEFSFDTAVTSDMTLYAKWKLNEFKISFNANGGTTDVSEKMVVYGNKLDTLPVPTCDYYTFTGWFTEKENGEKVTLDTLYEWEGDITLYAHWTQNAVSDWVLASSVPEEAEILDRKWSYTQTYYTTSSESYLDGWTHYNTTSVWSDYGNWSSWQDEWMQGYDWRQVESNPNVVAGYNQKKQYLYSRYYGWSSNGYYVACAYKSGVCTTYEETGWLDYALAWADTHYFGGKGYSAYEKGAVNGKSIYWYNQSSRQVDDYNSPIYKTQYRYRDRSLIYTYHYMKNENLESATYPTGDNVSNINEYVQYRAK